MDIESVNNKKNNESNDLLQRKLTSDKLEISTTNNKDSDVLNKQTRVEKLNHSPLNIKENNDHTNSEESTKQKTDTDEQIKMKDTIKTNSEMSAEKIAERRAAWKAKRLRSHLDPSELSIALKTIEEKNKSENLDNRKDNKISDEPLTSLEKHRRRYASKYNSNIEPSVVANLLKQLEEKNNNVSTTSPKAESKTTDDVFDESVVFRRSNALNRRAPITRRWSSAIEKTDVDSVIRSIEETGREIQLIGVPADKKFHDARPLRRTEAHTLTVNTLESKQMAHSDGKPENLQKHSNHVDSNDTNINKTVGDISGSALRMRRWKSHVEPTEVEKAFNLNRESESKDVKDTTPKLTGWRARVYGEDGSDTKSTEVSKRRQSESDRLSPSKVVHGDMDNATSITQKAILEHSSGRWRSNIDKSDVDKALENYVSSPMTPSDSSVYNNDGGITTTTSPLKRSNSRRNRSPDKPSPDDPRRWGKYYETFDFDKPGKDIDNGSSHNSAISVDITRDSDSKSAVITDDSKPKTVTVKKYSWSDIDDVKTSLTESSSRPTLRERLSSGNELRKEQQAQVLDISLNQYKTNMSSLDQARKQRTKALAAKFANYEDDWSLPVSPPSSTHNSLNRSNKVQEKSDDKITVETAKISHHQHALIKKDSTVLSEHKTEDEIPPVIIEAKHHDSPSERDDGFETGSDTVSQRTSMSSTLAEELGGTPTMMRRADHMRPKEDIEDECPVSPTNYFAASIDSLVQRPEFANSDKTPTAEDQGKLTQWSGKVSSDSPPTVQTDKSKQSSEDLSNNKTLTNTPTEEHEVVWTEHPINIDSPTEEVKEITSQAAAAENASCTQETIDTPVAPPRKKAFDRKSTLRTSIQRTNSPVPLRSTNSSRSATPTKFNSSISSSRSATPTKSNSSNSPRSKSGSNSSIVSEGSSHSGGIAPTQSKFMRPKKPGSNNAAAATADSQTSAAGAKAKPAAASWSRLTAPTASSLTRSQSVRVKKTSTSSPLTTKTTMRPISEVPTVPVRTSSMRVTPQEKSSIVKAATSASSRVPGNASAADSKSDSKVNRLITRLGSKGKTDTTDHGNKGSPSASSRLASSSKTDTTRKTTGPTGNRKIVVPKDLPLKKNESPKSLGATKVDAHPENLDTKKDRSPSFLKKMIKPVDKAPLRKSVLNKGDTNEKQSAADRRKAALSLGKTSAGKSSRC